MFDAYLRLQLGPIVERLAELETELEDLRRRGENHNRIGTVVAVDPGAKRCQVKHGELRTPWIKYFNPAAGEVSETRHPSVGEQCVLINFGAGDGSAQSVALCGIESGAFPAVSDRAELHRRTYPDGTETAYDHASHALTWSNGPLSVKADQSGVEVLLGGVGFKLTAAGFAHVGGGVTHDDVNIGKTHRHPPGSPLSGTPQ
ncbi:hypothetical protein 3S19_5 [uncultured Caudovirales phage]|uniref:Gp5/Type VI secretion system Vgr protein OB-fold domain-containing protein n=1 Tax=uncultured Caudovirales phage TaxID=2100421 RepID=A0A2H4JBW8_9CAUD|nr:hypothetical protein 3S19_5 [uncultured Caudovirales phage]